MLRSVFRVKQDGYYDFLRIAEHDYDDWAANMLFEEAVRGVSLKSRWNENWDFQILDEEEHAHHPGGLGDFAEMIRLIAATNERAVRVLRPLLPDAEVLTGNYNGGEITFFNILRRVDRKDIGKLDSGAVFRINPVGLDILCLADFKNAVERSGLKGLEFRKVDPDDPYGMV